MVNGKAGGMGIQSINSNAVHNSTIAESWLRSEPELWASQPVHKLHKVLCFFCIWVKVFPSEGITVNVCACLLQVVPRIIAENSGLNATDVVSSLHAAHANGQQLAGLDIETGQPKDLAEDGILDLYSAKWWALKLATDAVVTVLRVDQIIMSKQAGGPKPRQGGGDDED